MGNFFKRAKHGLIGFVPAILLVAMSVSAAEPIDEVSPTLREAMQRDLGLSREQLSQYLRVERLAELQQERLAAAQGPNFAGSWIERQANGTFKLVVATTAANPPRGNGDVEYRAARYDIAELNDSKAQLDALVQRNSKVPAGVYSWYVDAQSNAVVVGIAKGGEKAAIDFVAASQANTDLVRFVEEEQARPLAALKGGLGYLRDPGDGYLYACSIGFNALKSGVPVYVSAGHCGDAGEPVFLEGSAGTGPQWTLGPQIGTFSASSFPAPGGSGPDYSYVTISGSNSQLASVHGWTNADVVVRGSTAGGVGTAICRSGRTTRWKCGTIDQVDVSVNYTTGETITHVNRTTACSEGGDSGGSFITGPGQAQGVLSGGSGSCRGHLPNNRTRTYFQPVNPILGAYGLTLKTG
ncbi:MAG: S1 family peptidase [Rhodanobacteraceae bacterium]